MFCTVHFNNLTRGPNCGSAGNLQDDVFTGWHRWAALELESAMQSNTPWLSIPYWDWVQNPSKSDSLWSSTFLGPFDTDWSLGRDSSDDGTLPSGTAVSNVQAIGDFSNYTTSMENGNVHTGAHSWVDGVMASIISPKDPVFFFHHNTVDKLWQEWERAHGTSSFTKTSMPRYPSVDPDSLTDSRALGVFYAESGQVVLDQYDFSHVNPYRTAGATERFVYQFDIEARDGFNVPSGKKAEMRSCTQIRLRPGFSAALGSEFAARIDADCDFSTPL